MCNMYILKEIQAYNLEKYDSFTKLTLTII